ncbi:chromosome partitioning protein [Peribacillus simplex]
MTKVITFANFKGGVGKTTASVLSAYLLQKQGKKVLLVDFDPQANSTEIIAKTFDIELKKGITYIFEGIEDGDLSKSILPVSPNLGILPSNLKLVEFPSFIHDLTKDKKGRFTALYFLLKPIKDQYDFIIIDVPPTINDFTNNALFASDFVVLVMQTQEQAYTAAAKFNSHLQGFKKDYHIPTKLLGVMPYLVNKTGKVDIEVMAATKELFGPYVLENIIFKRERIKLFGKEGITNKDMHDAAVLNMYQAVLDELLERIDI